MKLTKRELEATRRAVEKIDSGRFDTCYLALSLPGRFETRLLRNKFSDFCQKIRFDSCWSDTSPQSQRERVMALLWFAEVFK